MAYDKSLGSSSSGFFEIKIIKSNYVPAYEMSQAMLKPLHLMFCAFCVGFCHYGIYYTHEGT